MQLFDFQFMLECVPEILIKGVPVALEIACVSFFFGLILGLIAALCKIYKIPVLRQLATVYISFFRGTPLVVQILIASFGVPIILRYINYRFGTNFDVSGVPQIYIMFITYSLYIGSFLSETIRTAILSVPPGQVEAGHSLGMTTPQVLKRVIIPQALTVALPVFGNTFIGLLKDTSLAFIAAIPDILGQAKIIAGRTSMFLESYIVAALIYWALCIILEQILRLLEKRSRKHERRN